MRSLAGQLLVPMLATLLVLTTPVGTGQGVHQNELLHPLLPHAHLIDGRIVSDAAARTAAIPDPVRSQAPSGPALGAGIGADTPGLGLTLGPALPVLGPLIAATPESRVRISEGVVPAEFRDPPQDPPPDPFG
jgi:hypothetical protein